MRAFVARGCEEGFRIRLFHHPPRLSLSLGLLCLELALLDLALALLDLALALLLEEEPKKTPLRRWSNRRRMGINKRRMGRMRLHPPLCLVC